MVLRRLTAAPRTRHDLREDLLRRNIPEDVVDRVLDRFTDVGLIDDAAYAHAWVESRQRTRGAARAVLRQELRAKGIAEEHAEVALAEIDPEQERDRARRLVESKLASVARLDAGTRTRRLVGLLQRRGYSASVAFAVVREVTDDMSVDDSELDS